MFIEREGVYVFAASILFLGVGLWVVFPELGWQLRRLGRVRRRRRFGGTL